MFGTKVTAHGGGGAAALLIPLAKSKQKTTAVKRSTASEATTAQLGFDKTLEKACRNGAEGQSNKSGAVIAKEKEVKAERTKKPGERDEGRLKNNKKGGEDNLDVAADGTTGDPLAEDIESGAQSNSDETPEKGEGDGEQVKVAEAQGVAVVPEQAVGKVVVDLSPAASVSGVQEAVVKAEGGGQEASGGEALAAREAPVKEKASGIEGLKSKNDAQKGEGVSSKTQAEKAVAAAGKDSIPQEIAATEQTEAPPATVSKAMKASHEKGISKPGPTNEGVATSAQAPAAQAVIPPALIQAIESTQSQSAAISAPSREGETKPVTSEPTVTGVGVEGFLKDDAKGAEAASSAQELPKADSNETFDQVVLGLKGKMDARTGKAEIRLEPPNLGVVRVSVSLENGTLTAQFQSESDAVRNLLKGNLEKLKTVLEGQGVAVDRLAVDAPSKPSTAQGQGQGQESSFGSAAHDGRSAGQNHPDARQGQKQAEPNGFARLFRQTQEAPIDLVA